MRVLADARTVAPYFVIAALALVLGVVVLRRNGAFAETILLSGGAAAAAVPEEERSLKLVTLLPKDGIPAIFHPQFVDATGAAEQLRPNDLVIGVSVNREHRAYGVAYLSRHEVVNDVVGGRAIAVTW